MDLKQTFDELAKQVKENNWVDNMDEVQEAYIFLKKELSLNKEQIVRLKSDLNESQEKNFELQRQLELSNTKLRESEFKLKLTGSKCQSLENKLKQVNNAYADILMKEKMMAFELEVLQNNLEALGAEKIKLTRENYELQETLKYHNTLQTEVTAQQEKTSFLLKTINENMKKFENQQLDAKEINAIDIAENFKKNIILLHENINKLTEERNTFQQKFINASSKCEKLENLLNVNNFTPLEALIISQYKVRIKILQEKTEKDTETLKTTSEALTNQIKINEELLATIESLEGKLCKDNSVPENELTN